METRSLSLTSSIAALCLAFTAPSSAQTLEVGPNRNFGPSNPFATTDIESVLMPFTLNEFANIQSVRFRMGRRRPILDGFDVVGNVDVFITRAAPTPPNFVDVFAGSSVVIPVSNPGLETVGTAVESTFNNQRLQPGQYWLRLAFAVPFAGIGNWYPPGANPSIATSQTIYFNRINQSGWTAQTEWPRFTLVYGNGTFEVGGTSCSGTQSSPVLQAPLPRDGQQTIQLRGSGPATSPVAMLLGFGRFPGDGLPLDPIGASGCRLHADSIIAISGTTSPSGLWDVALEYSSPFTFFTQFVIVAPGENPAGLLTTSWGRTFTGNGTF